MKEYKIEKKHFIGGWYINEKTCDEIRESFKKIPTPFKEEGLAGKKNKKLVNKKVKESLDITVSSSNKNYPLNKYAAELQNCLEKYQNKFTEVKELQKFNLSRGGYNIQSYPVGGGFKKWHCERTGLLNTDRILVFMTYLNDVSDGGTYFKYQKLRIPAHKGLTIIWPSDWTHTHKGQISKKYEKYIVTGWFTFTPKEE